MEDKTKEKELKFEAWVYTKYPCKDFIVDCDCKKLRVGRIICQNRDECKNFCERCYIRLV